MRKSLTRKDCNFSYKILFSLNYVLNLIDGYRDSKANPEANKLSILYKIFNSNYDKNQETDKLRIQAELKSGKEE